MSPQDADPLYVPEDDPKAVRRAHRKHNARKHVVSNRSILTLAALTGVSRRRLVRRKGKRK